MFIDIQQNSDAWLELRNGKVTGSAIAKIMANYGKAFGEPAKKLAVDVAVARITGKLAVSDNYTNAHMERGHEQEPFARELYEFTTFSDVTNGGFFDNGNNGCSPDGLVGDDGVIEIKSVIPSVHYKRIDKGGYDASYRWQLMFNLKETGRGWIDFVSYCHDFPIEKRLYIFRINKSDCVEDWKMIDKRLSEFENLILEITNRIK